MVSTTKLEAFDKAKLTGTTNFLIFLRRLMEQHMWSVAPMSINQAYKVQIDKTRLP